MLNSVGLNTAGSKGIRSATIRRPSGCRGFSLVELLVVVLIIGLGISFVSTNIGGNNSYRLRIEAQQFANNVSLIAEEAVLSNQQWGVDIFRFDDAGDDRFGYRWLVRNDDGVWQLANADNMEVEFLFSKGIGLRLQLDGIDEEQVIESKREITEQAGLFDTEDDDRRVIDGQGLVEKEPIEPAIWLLSSGEMNAFILTVFDQQTFADNGADGNIDIEGDVLGRIKLQTDADDEDV